MWLNAMFIDPLMIQNACGYHWLIGSTDMQFLLIDDSKFTMI